jgi:hypothetical protein
VHFLCSAAEFVFQLAHPIKEGLHQLITERVEAAAAGVIFLRPVLVKNLLQEVAVEVEGAVQEMQAQQEMLVLLVIQVAPQRLLR